MDDSPSKPQCGDANQSVRRRFIEDEHPGRPDAMRPPRWHGVPAARRRRAAAAGSARAAALQEANPARFGGLPGKPDLTCSASACFAVDALAATAAADHAAPVGAGMSNEQPLSGSPYSEK